MRNEGTFDRSIWNWNDSGSYVFFHISFWLTIFKNEKLERNYKYEFEFSEVLTLFDFVLKKNIRWKDWNRIYHFKVLCWKSRCSLFSCFAKFKWFTIQFESRSTAICYRSKIPRALFPFPVQKLQELLFWFMGKKEKLTNVFCSRLINQKTYWNVYSTTSSITIVYVRQIWHPLVDGHLVDGMKKKQGRKFLFWRMDY